MYLKCFPVPESSGLISHNLQHEEMLVCQPLHGCIHSYCSGLLLWMMRPCCHCKCKCRWVFCKKLEFFQFLWKENETDHSCSHHSSRSFSRWKVMVPKVTPYNVNRGPVCFLPWHSESCLWDKHPKQCWTVEHSEVVQKCKATVAVVLESVWCPGGEHLNNKCPIKDFHTCFRWVVCSNVCSKCLCWLVVPLPAYKVQVQFHW